MLSTRLKSDGNESFFFRSNISQMVFWCLFTYNLHVDVYASFYK